MCLLKVIYSDISHSEKGDIFYSPFLLLMILFKFLFFLQGTIQQYGPLVEEDPKGLNAYSIQI